MATATAPIALKLPLGTILKMPLPEFHARAARWSAETRAVAIVRLFASLGVAIEAGPMNAALDYRAVYVKLPDSPHYAGADRKHSAATCPTCLHRAAAKAHARAMILAAFPDFEATDWSDSTERFDDRLNLV